MTGEAKEQFAAVVRVDPKREAAWKRLGYKKQGGQWATDEQVAAARAEADAHKKADKHWRPILERLRARLDGKDRVRRAEAEASLAEVTDPRAVPSVWRDITRIRLASRIGVSGWFSMPLSFNSAEPTNRWP